MAVEVTGFNIRIRGILANTIWTLLIVFRADLDHVTCLLLLVRPEHFYVVCFVSKYERVSFRNGWPGFCYYQPWYIRSGRGYNHQSTVNQLLCPAVRHDTFSGV